MTDFQTEMNLKDLACYRLKGAVTAFVDMPCMSAEERLQRIAEALATCNAEHAAVDAQRAARRAANPGTF